jgi:hypothetical protein
MPPKHSGERTSSAECSRSLVRRGLVLPRAGERVRQRTGGLKLLRQLTPGPMRLT